MKKIAYLLITIASFSIFSCGSSSSVVPVSDKIKKTWIANIVKEGNTTVYTKGAASNTAPKYSNFKLNLVSAPSVSLTEFDGNTFAGQYSLPSDTRLVLSGLTPVPTNSGGTIEFTINSISDTELNITRTTTSPKTGNTINTYSLIPQ